VCAQEWDIENPKKLRAHCLAGCGRRTNTVVAKFCSMACERRYRYLERVRLLEAGEYPPCRFSSGFIRRYLVARIGERCAAAAGVSAIR
jgi:hypothetical protein